MKHGRNPPMRFGKCGLTLILILASFFTGCSSSEIVQTSPDTFVASRTSAAGAFADISKLKKDVLKDANAYAEERGLVAVPVQVNESRPNVGFPSCEVIFTLMSREDYAAIRARDQADWASLTPAQRLEYNLRQDEIRQRDRSLASSERVASSQASQQALQGALDRSSYDRRTQAIQEPVNINVQGEMNHNVRGTFDHRVRSY